MAAHELAGRFQNERYADYDGYPVLYLYRHALELYLKALVYRGGCLMSLIGEDTPELPGLFRQHTLSQFLPAVRAIFHAMGWTFEGTEVSCFERFRQIIHDLDDIDPGSYVFRYPVNIKGEANVPHHFMVNIPAFAKTMDPLLMYLEGAPQQLEEEFQAEAAARHEVQQLLDEWSE